MLFFGERGKRTTRRKTSRSKGENQQQTVFAYTELESIDEGGGGGGGGVVPLGLVAGINFIVNGGGGGRGGRGGRGGGGH